MLFIVFLLCIITAGIGSPTLPSTARRRPTLAMIGVIRPSAVELRALASGKFKRNTAIVDVKEEESVVVPAGPRSFRSVVMDAPSMTWGYVTGAGRLSLRFARFMGRWVVERWQVKLCYFFIGAFVVRVCLNGLKAMRLNFLEAGDIYLDANDAEYLNRGTICEEEAQYMQNELRRIGRLSTSVYSKNFYSDIPSSLAFLSEAQIEAATKAQQVLGVRCRPRKRGRYVMELAAGVRQLSTAMTAANITGDVSPEMLESDSRMNSVEGGDDSATSTTSLPALQRTCLQHALLLSVVRLADAELRFVRDALLASAREIHALSLFWQEKKQRDHRMNFLISFLLGALYHHGHGLDGKRFTLLKDQERIVALELMLCRYLYRLGLVEQLLLQRPRVKLSVAPGEPIITKPVAQSLEQWATSGLELITETVREEMVGLVPPQSKTSSGTQYSQPESSTAPRSNEEATSDINTVAVIQSSNAAGAGTGVAVERNREGWGGRGGHSIDMNYKATPSSVGSTSALPYPLVHWEPVAMVTLVERERRRTAALQAMKVQQPSSSRWRWDGNVGALVRRYIPSKRRPTKSKSLRTRPEAITKSPALHAPNTANTEAEEIKNIEETNLDENNVVEDFDDNSYEFDGIDDDDAHSGLESTSESKGDAEEETDIPLPLLLVRRAQRVTRLSKMGKARMQVMIASAAAGKPKQKRYVRNIMLVALAPILTRGGLRAYERREEVAVMSRDARKGLETFFEEQLLAPSKAIVQGVLFRRRQALMDENAISDAKLSVQNLLSDFIKDTEPLVSAEERRRRSQAMDMSSVSRQLEQQAPAAVFNMITGRIVRIMLIQMQFVKLEMMMAMQAIDDLYNANQLNLQLLASFPALLVVAGVYLAAKNVFYAVASQRLAPTAQVHMAMRSCLREIERLLTSSAGFAGGVGIPTQQPSAESAGGSGSDEQPQTGSIIQKPSAYNRCLSAEEYGRLALHIHSLQILLAQNASRFDHRVRRRLEEDVRDLVKGVMTVPQQLSVVKRMQSSYSFLQVKEGRGRGPLNVIG